MKPLSYVISKQALLDLESIWLYTSDTWSIDQADRYYSLIIGEIKYLGKNTLAGKSMAHIRQGYRASKVKSHIVFYRITGNCIEIIRILHERMDIDNRFGSLKHIPDHPYSASPYSKQKA